jgi:hypothetical protein
MEIFNFEDKVVGKLVDTTLRAKDVNNIVNYLNYCFSSKNDFNIDKFNKTSLKNIQHFYNKLKTNIIMVSSYSIFDNIEEVELKAIKYVFQTLLNKYSDIHNDMTNSGVIMEKQDVRNIITGIGNVINQYAQLNR